MRTTNELATGFKITLVAAFIFMGLQQGEAKTLERIAEKNEAKIESKAEKCEEHQGDDEIEDTIDGKNKKNEEDKKPAVVWNKYDFIPGDTVIFEDGPSPDEENGEFPDRWDLYKGNAEIAEVDGENVIFFRERNGFISPYLKNAKEDYLPEIFTIEFDVYFEPSVTYYNIFLWDKKNQTTPQQNRKSSFQITVNKIRTDGSTDYFYPGTEKLGHYKNPDVNWRHISLAFTKGKLKIYMDDTRIINIPHFENNPTGITIEGSGNGNNNEVRFLKNIRIAKGGVKYYDRVLSEGKIIVNGIRFDVNKATLKPESMGPINKIYRLMQKQPDLKFSVEGHTDTDGDNEFNQTLSEARGKTVMEKLIEMGISVNRLKSNGFGESKPIDNNNTPEGKANNRRVEFVKK